ncbi:hypothetical protein ACIGHB_30190 [Streptomyces sp. NPDC085460]|uniref:hypothetical protein n=1 Tax=Streptomyces sp. NPDC085460 TaxID=3365723 RepID=UPI0037D7A36D
MFTELVQAQADTTGGQRDSPDAAVFSWNAPLAQLLSGRIDLHQVVGGKRMLKILLEQWKANQEQKRAIAGEKWEQEKRWREEDRNTAREKEAAARERQAAESQKKAEEAAQQEETYKFLYKHHLQVLRKAATVSYVSLNCHEDTWTFLARRTFGTWSPEWLTSVSQGSEQTGITGPKGKVGFIKDPNLVPGRITKHTNGMQTVEVSGANLVAILESLWEGAYGRNIYKALTDVDPSRRACGPLHTRFSDWLDSLEAASASAPGHTLVLDERIESAV